MALKAAADRPDPFAESSLVPADLVGRVSPFAAIFSGLFAGGLPTILGVLAVIGLGWRVGVLGLRHRDLQLG